MAKASTATTGSATSLPQCTSCKCEVGVEAKCVPFFVDDHHAEGERAKYESFCPQCFVYVRAPREIPSRWQAGFFIPCACAKCGITSVATRVSDAGRPICPRCGSTRTLLLPPKAGIV